jgi:ligand-binding SRPBCC domain-containing protein
MALLEHKLTFGRPVADVFDFFCQPAHWVLISPPDLRLQLVEWPERIDLGACVIVKSRRWGMPQQVVTAITAFEPNRLIVQEQRQGPFARWIHAPRFEVVAVGTRLIDQIVYEPPRGLLGLTLTPAFLARDLERIFAFRSKKLSEVWGESPELGE